MSATSIFRWRGCALHPIDEREAIGADTIAADSWLVDDGATLAIGLHRTRFLATIRQLDQSAAPDETNGVEDAEQFWDAAVAAIPRVGAWLPRVELHEGADGARFTFHLRAAPARSRSVRLVTHRGRDPRSSPRITGTDAMALLDARRSAQEVGADEAVIVSADGSVVEGTASALLWWRGDALCAPSPELERVDSVTARSVITLATALGTDVLHESVTPGELDGLEVWALDALHGIRIATVWFDGPALAEKPGRLRAWRTRLDRLRRLL